MPTYPKNKRLQDREFLDSFHGKRCSACGRPGSDPAHIKTRGSGGDDVWDNVLALCRRHHTEQGQIGWQKFAMKYERVMMDLKARGWYFDDRGRILK